MHGYDRLPPELRAWLAHAALPWSSGSVLRLWQRFLRETGGDRGRALARMDQAEARMLMRDCRRIWCGDHPGLPARPASPAGDARGLRRG